MTIVFVILILVLLAILAAVVMEVAAKIRVNLARKADTNSAEGKTSATGDQPGVVGDEVFPAKDPPLTPKKKEDKQQDEDPPGEQQRLR